MKVNDGRVVWLKKEVIVRQINMDLSCSSSIISSSSVSYPLLFSSSSIIISYPLLFSSSIIIISYPLLFSSSIGISYPLLFSSSSSGSYTISGCFSD